MDSTTHRSTTRTSSAPRRWSWPSAAAGASARTRWSARSSSRDGEVIGEGYHHDYGGPHAERAAIESLQQGHDRRRRSTSRSSPAPPGRQPPCTDAILEAGIARVVDRLRRPDREGHRPRPGHPARRGRRGRSRARARLAAARPPAQPAVPQARPDRPPARALQVGDDARRQGRDRDRRLAVDLRRREPRARPPLARRVRRGRRRHRHRALRRPAADRAPRGRRPRRQPTRVVFDSEARLPLDCAARRERSRGAADRRRSPRRAARGARRRSRRSAST